MFIEDVLRTKLLDKLESLVSELKEDIKFQNIAGTDKWEIQLCVDLSSLPTAERNILTAMLSFF